MDEDRYYNLGSHDKLFNQIDELTDALASRDAEIESLRQQIEWVRNILASHGYDGPFGDGCCPLSEWLNEREELRQQLSAALAACKAKSDMLSVIDAAKEAGIHENWNPSDWYSVSPEQLEYFYAIAFEAGSVAELEECFSLKKDALEIFNFNPLETSQEVRDVIEWFSGAIRARSTK